MSEIEINIGNATTDPASNRLSIKSLSPLELRKCFVTQYRSVWMDRASDFMSSGGTAQERQTRHGVNYSIIRRTSVPAGDYQRLVGVISTAMDCLLQCPSIRFELHPITFVVDSVSGSAGYVVRKSLYEEAQIWVFLGADVWGAQRTTTGIIANYLHKYIRGSNNYEKSRRRTLTAVFHEFGHVFHQLASPSHYFVLGEFSFLWSKTQGELLKNAPYHELWRLFPGFPSVAYMKKFHQGLARYVSAHVSSYAAGREPEIVAEVFSGLMMGITFPPEVLALYRALGGHVPEDEMRYETQEIAVIEDLIHRWAQP
jgi:hypothetical protein